MDARTIDVERARADDAYRDGLYEHLEEGGILVLEQSPFLPPAADAEFLRAQAQSSNAAHKNIAYKPNLGRVTGAAGGDARLTQVLGNYSRGALACMAELLPRYAAAWTVDYASFRPFEEQGRELPMKRRNDLLHVDSFPTRPTHGGGILRLFTNLHTTRERVWVTSGPFEQLAMEHARGAGLEQTTGAAHAAWRAVLRAAAGLGAPVKVRYPYDEFMLRLHDHLKADPRFQKEGRRDEHHFGPGQSWISFTDRLGHAVLSGQFALEQTCIVPLEALRRPDWSPLAILERLSGRPLAPHKPAPGRSAGMDRSTPARGEAGRTTPAGAR
jgi:hypothetical protein